MARLFITPREIDFINDINKEIIKDVIGQRIYLFPISTYKTKIHDVYEESPDKIFENPVAVDALVSWDPEDYRTDTFGVENFLKADVWLQSRDLIDKGIAIDVGDFFSYGDTFFEVTSYRPQNSIYGQIEYEGSIKLEARQSRRGNFLSKVFGPTNEAYNDPDSIQERFIQQRGYATNKDGTTNDVRDLQKKGVLDPPLTGPSEASPLGDTTGGKSSFYEDQ